MNFELIIAALWLGTMGELSKTPWSGEFRCMRSLASMVLNHAALNNFPSQDDTFRAGQTSGRFLEIILIFEPIVLTETDSLIGWLRSMHSQRLYFPPFDI